MSRILVVGPSWVGDMVMAQSLFKVIRQRDPVAEISVLAPAWSEPVLARMPEVGDSIDMPVGHGSLQLGKRRALARDLRNREFDQAIVLPGSLKSALIPWFAKIPRRTGFVGEQRWGLLNDIRRLDKQAMPRNVQRYAVLGLDKNEAIPTNPPWPELEVEQHALDKALEKFGLNRDKPVIGICPGAEYGPAKRWPVEHFAESAGELSRLGWQVWIFGSEKDRDVSDEINRQSGGSCANLAGRTTLGEAIDLMSLAEHVVTNDSGLMHVAAATGSHVVAIYGSSSDVFTPPLTDLCHRLSLNLECSPCFKRECPLGHLNCLRQLDPSRVLALLDFPGRAPEDP